MTTDADLEAALDRMLADLKAEALELHRKGVPVEQIVELAPAIINARARGVLRSLPQFAIARPRGYG